MTTTVQITGTLLHHSLFQQTQVNGKGDPNYRATVVLDLNANDVNGIHAAMVEAFRNKFPNLDPNQIQVDWAWRQPDPSKFPQLAGGYMINAKEKDASRAPQLFDANVQPLQPQTPLFMGCKVVALVNFYGYLNSGKYGVGAGLVGLQLIDNRPELRIGGQQVDAAQAFQPVPGAPVQLAPTAFSGAQGAPQGQPPGNAPAYGYGAPGPAQAPAAPTGQPAGVTPAAGYGAPPASPAPAGGYAPPQQQNPMAPPQGAQMPQQGYPPGAPAATGPGAAVPPGAPPSSGAPPGGWPYQQ